MWVFKDFIFSFMAHEKNLLKKNETLIQEENFFHDDAYLQFFLGNWFLNFMLNNKEFMYWLFIVTFYLLNNLYISLMAHY
jgi:hypothetical protein